MVHVLVVDDDDAVRETLRTLLEDSGYDVSDVDNGEAALAMLRAAPASFVVLLDYVMAGMNGGELLRLAAAEGLQSRHGFVLMSASPRQIDADPFIHQYTVDHTASVISKPFDIDDLLAVVASSAAHLPPAADQKSVLALQSSAQNQRTHQD